MSLPIMIGYPSFHVKETNPLFGDQHPQENGRSIDQIPGCCPFECDNSPNRPPKSRAFPLLQRARGAYCATSFPFDDNRATLLAIQQSDILCCATQIHLGSRVFFLIMAADEKQGLPVLQ